ncbi:MAG: FUSC family protein [Rhodocyclaceae bacterium]|nr:FUSC family protein [Rhodocyclaceae bacterium]
MRFKLPASAARQLYGQYLFSGATVALGLFLVWVGAQYTLGALAPASVLGALCVSLCDTPAPSGHKFIELALALVCTSLSAFATALISAHPLLLGVGVTVVAFVSAMLTAYGRRAMPLSFATLLAALVTMEQSIAELRVALHHSAGFVAGGLGYLAFGVTAARLTDRLTRQQVLGECLLEFGAYLRAKAAFYDPGTELDRCYAQLVAQQSVMSEKFQIARDILFRRVRGTERRHLAAAMVAFIDLYERVLTTHTDYDVLRAHYSARGLLEPLARFCLDSADELDRLGLEVLKHGRSEDGQAARALDPAELLPAAGQGGEPLDARMALASAYSKVRRAAAALAQLRTVLTAPDHADAALRQHRLGAFVSRGTYRPSLLIGQLRPSSPTFRYALRLAAAILCGYLLAPLLPFSDHGNWILLTTAVVMRANFSQTRARRMDRVIGNLSGCLIAAVLLHFAPGRAAILSVLFLSVAVTHTFATQNYRIASTSGCVLAFMLLHELAPAEQHLIEARILDTFVGAALATLFSYLLPWWEYRSMAALLRDLAATSAEFAQRALDPRASDHSYRLARKRFQDAIALVTGSYRRMLDEPASRRRAEKTLPRLLAANYELGAQLASIHAARLDLTDRIAARELETMLERARIAIAGELSGSGRDAPADANAAAELANAPDPLDAGRLLARRLRLMVRAAANTARLEKTAMEEVLH